MTLFIAICSLLAASAILLLVWPLLRPASVDAPALPRAGIAATIVAALLPVAAFVIYFWASNWNWDAQEQPVSVSAVDLKRVIAELQVRLARQPDDVERWKLLGRTATVVGEYAIARDAFGEAYTRTKGQDAEAVVGYAESLVLNDEREIDGHAAQLFEQALAIAPDNPRALWYGGIVAYRRGDLALAQQRWVELQNYELTPDLRQVLAERLSELERSQGKPAAGSGTAQSVPGGIEISIGIAPELANQTRPNSTLFVIARRGNAGPPLAVVRRSVGAWPITVGLSDVDAMLPGMSLADGGPITLIARISRSGEPIAASGDLFGEVGYDFTSAHPAKITIDRIVP
ncbi:MAG: tetratricopeptide repeat protein [Steroidobacteraceae bacterium]